MEGEWVGGVVVGWAWVVVGCGCPLVTSVPRARGDVPNALRCVPSADGDACLAQRDVPHAKGDLPVARQDAPDAREVVPNARGVAPQRVEDVPGALRSRSLVVGHPCQHPQCGPNWIA